MLLVYLQGVPFKIKVDVEVVLKTCGVNSEQL